MPPGADNFRDVKLTLTPAASAAPGSYNFAVNAVSAADSTTAGSAAGTINVAGAGVKVALSPSTAAPGDACQMTVTNLGTASDTFDLTLAGPAALISQLQISRLTLGPGGSQVVSITTSPADFALSGELQLTAAATSRTDPAVEDAATTALKVPPSVGMTAEFEPASQSLPGAGEGSFLLAVHNTGNTEDAYTATIIDATGGVVANLAGLTGDATQSVPIFRIPGLSTADVLLQVSLAAAGTGTVTVRVTSLSNGAITSTAVASLDVGSQPPENQAPVAQGASASVGYHDAAGADIPLTATDAQHDSLTYGLVGPEGGQCMEQ